MRACNGPWTLLAALCVPLEPPAVASAISPRPARRAPRRFGAGAGLPLAQLGSVIRWRRSAAGPAQLALLDNKGPALQLSCSPSCLMALAWRVKTRALARPGHSRLDCSRLSSPRAFTSACSAFDGPLAASSKGQLGRGDGRAKPPPC